MRAIRRAQSFWKGRLPEVQEGKKARVWIVDENSYFHYWGVRLFYPPLPASRQEMAYLRALEFLLQHGGTKTHPEQSWGRWLEDHGIQWSVTLDRYAMELEFAVPRPALPASLRAVREFFQEALFPESVFETARQVLLTALQRRYEEPSDISLRIARRLTYGPWHPAAMDYGIPALQALQLPEVERRWREWRAPRAVIWYAGPQNPEAWLDEVASLLRVSGEAPPPLPPMPAFQGIFLFHPREDTAEVSIVAAGVGCRRDAEDYPARLLGVRLLVGPNATGRLFRRIRSRMGWAYGVYLDVGADMLVPGMANLQIGVYPETVHSAIRTAVRTIAEIASGEFTDEEMEHAREAFLNQMIFFREKPLQRVLQAVDLVSFGYPLDFEERLFRAVRALRREDVQEAVAQAFPLEQWIWVLTGPPEVEGTLRALGEVARLELRLPEPGVPEIGIYF